VQKLGRNQGRYHGETIDVAAYVRDLDIASRCHDWRSEVFFDDGESKLFALRRTFGTPRRRIYISSGIHGDEPAGPLALLQLIQEHRWPAGLDLWLCPCLNPAGLARNTRENLDGLDLNRRYHHLDAPETRAHAGWLQRQPAFDLALCLHEDWESHGFYLYELNPDQHPSLAEQIIRAVNPVCPIDPSDIIEGREAHGGIIRPISDPLARPEWPEAFYLLQHKTRLSYTLEAPSDFPMTTRVNALVAAVRAATGS
jgi:hypothetical protein